MTITITTSTVNAFVNTGFGTGSFSSSGVLGGTNFPAGSKAIISVLNSGKTAGTNWSLGGNAMSIAVQSTDFNATQYYIDLTVSTSDTVSFNGGNNTSFYLITARYLTNASSGGPTATAFDVFGANQQVYSTTLTTPSSGIQTSLAYNINSNPLTTVWTWTNATQDFANASATAATIQMAGATESSASGSITITASGTGPANTTFNYGMNTAAWGAATVTGPPIDIIYGAEVDTVHSYTRAYEVIGY